MSLIEQAAKRLEQLRQAGVQMPADGPPAKAPAAIPAYGVMRDLPVDEPPKSAVVPAPPPLAPAPDAGARDGGVPAAISRRVELDWPALAAKHIISPDNLRSRTSDEFRLIKRPLIANAMGRSAAPIANGNLIMITSALPREGKSYTAVNLAISIAAEFDNTVLLVDADVARPSVLNLLGLPPGPGLLDMISGTRADLSEVLLRTDVEKLALLPSGTPRQRATELLASDAMIALLQDLANRYPDRIIIFDSPPLLLTTESRVLAAHMGQIVVVVQAERTSQAELRQALATIESCPVKMMLLNQVRAVGGDTYGYGYGFGYGYGHAG